MKVKVMNGVQVRPNATVAEILEAYNLGARLFRFQIFNNENKPDWMKEVEAQTDVFVSMYPQLPTDATFILDLHNTANWESVDSFEIRGAVIAYWMQTVIKLAHMPNVHYGILNEPKGTVANVNGLMKNAHDVIRDLEKTYSIPAKIICVTTPGANPTLINKIGIIDDPKVWYEIHFYFPMKFTGQQIPNSEFPKECALTPALIEKMKTTLANAYAFHKKYPDKQIYIGEFGCVDFAPEQDRKKWFRTCYQHWNRLRVHSTLHAWREWEHWQPSGACLEVVKNNLK